MFVDQAYWMGAIASKPSASYKGYSELRAEPHVAILALIGMMVLCAGCSIMLPHVGSEIVGNFSLCFCCLMRCAVLGGLLWFW